MPTTRALSGYVISAGNMLTTTAFSAYFINAGNMLTTTDTLLVQVTC